MRDDEASFECPTLDGESFDKILLDAPCSGLGQRPQLLVASLTQRVIESFGPVQRKLIVRAESLLKNGGTLVYCTCSLSPDENELVVEYALRECPSLRLARQDVFLGRPGALGLDMCQRFGLATCDVDCVAFFIAKFVKTISD